MATETSLSCYRPKLLFVPEREAKYYDPNRHRHPHWEGGGLKLYEMETICVYGELGKKLAGLTPEERQDESFFLGGGLS